MTDSLQYADRLQPRWVRWAGRGLVWYRAVLSPDHGPLRVFFPAGVCRFEPTCSHYAEAALRQHGWFGLWLLVRRLGRCHPLARGGYDPVPDRLISKSSKFSEISKSVHSARPVPNLLELPAYAKALAGRLIN